MAEDDEPSALGGRTPEPGPARGAQSAAAASRIRVDISDVAKLKTVIKDTQVQAKGLSDTLAGFDTKALPTIRAVRTELEAMQRALGVSGVRGASGPRSTGGGGGSYIPTPSFAGQPAGSAHTAMVVGGSYTQPSAAAVPYADTLARSKAIGQPTPQQAGGGWRSYLSWSYLTSPTPSGTKTSPPAWSTTPLFRGAVGALGAVAGLSALASTHRQDAIARSYLLNQSQLLTGGDIGTRAQIGLGRGLTQAMGNTGLSYADVTSAFGTLTTSGVTGGAYGASRMQSVGFLSAINPTQGNQVSAQQVASTFTSQNYYRMRLAGINASIANGQNINAIFDQIINRIEGAMGRPATNTEIMSGLQQGTHLNADLTAMGLSQDMIVQIVQYWSSRRRTGRTGLAAIQGSGAQNNAAFATQQAGAASARAGAKVDRGFIPGVTAGARLKGREWNALGDAVDNPAGAALTYAAGAVSDFTSEVNLATKALKALVEWEVAKTVLGGGKTAAAATTASRATTAASAGEEAASVSRFGALARNPLLRKAGYVGAAITVGDMAKHTYDLGKTHKNAPWYMGPPHVLEDTGKTLWYGASSTAKGAWGAVNTAKNLVNSALHWPWGGSNDDANIWGGSGQTYKTLEQMAAKGPREIVTSTTGGQHAQGSYHYKGQAIDLADKAGSVDSPGLLAINRFFAKNYGHKLAELIYAGPGGINIKDGKVVNGMAMYGAATMAEHHNHVHVAATPGSLGMSGGVSVHGGKSGGPEAASSSGGFATPGGSPAASMGASSVIDDVFTTSSGDALLAALAGSFGGGMAGFGTGQRAGGSGSRSGAGVNVSSAPSNPSANARLGRQMAAKRGWTGKEWDALYWLWDHESSWDSNAVNKSSGAAGIPQALGHGNVFALGDASAQIKWGLNYISGRYGDPLGAVQHEKKYNWYERGAFDVLRDEIAQLHKGEMVLPAGTAAKVRQLVETPQSTQAQSVGMSPRRVVPVQLVFYGADGNEATARKHAKRFADFVAEEHGIDMVASR